MIGFESSAYKITYLTILNSRTEKSKLKESELAETDFQDWGSFYVDVYGFIKPFLREI